jgi:hypothetical protein
LESVAPSFQAALLRLRARGEVRDDMPVHAQVRMIISVIASYVLLRQVLYPERAWDDDEERRASLRFLCDGLRPQAPAAAKRAAKPKRPARPRHR